MAHSVSARKRNRQAEKLLLRNRAIKREIATFRKRFLTALEAGDKEKATETLSQCVSKMDKALKKGVLHGNLVARRKSLLWRSLNHKFAAA